MQILNVLFSSQNFPHEQKKKTSWVLIPFAYDLENKKVTKVFS